MSALNPMVAAAMGAISHIRSCGADGCVEMAAAKEVTDIALRLYGFKAVASEACQALDGAIEICGGIDSELDANGAFTLFRLDGHWGYAITDERLQGEPGIESALRIYVTYRNMMADLSDPSAFAEAKADLLTALNAGDGERALQLITAYVEDPALSRIVQGWITIADSTRPEDRPVVVYSLLGLATEVLIGGRK